VDFLFITLMGSRKGSSVMLPIKSSMWAGKVNFTYTLKISPFRKMTGGVSPAASNPLSLLYKLLSPIYQRFIALFLQVSLYLSPSTSYNTQMDSNSPTKRTYIILLLSAQSAALYVHTIWATARYSTASLLLFHRKIFKSAASGNLISQVR
jgi:hypothetical protein